jgi:hypothetical protein
MEAYRGVDMEIFTQETGKEQIILQFLFYYYVIARLIK